MANNSSSNANDDEWAAQGAKPKQNKLTKKDEIAVRTWEEDEAFYNDDDWETPDENKPANNVNNTPSDERTDRWAAQGARPKCRQEKGEKEKPKQAIKLTELDEELSYIWEEEDKVLPDNGLEWYEQPLPENYRPPTPDNEDNHRISTCHYRNNQGKGYESDWFWAIAHQRNFKSIWARMTRGTPEDIARERAEQEARGDRYICFDDRAQG